MNSIRIFDALATLHKRNPDAFTIPPKRLNWHALRHFAISCWIDAGRKPKTIQTFAGHATLAITMDRYGHLFKSDEHKEAMNQIVAEFAAIEPRPPKAAPNKRKTAQELIP